MHYPEYLSQEGAENGMFAISFLSRVNNQLQEMHYKPRLKCRISAKINVPEGMRPKFRAIYKYRGNVGQNRYSRSLQGCDLMTNAEFQSYINEIMPP